MSIQALAWVLEYSGSQGAARNVLIAIANHMSEGGIAWPGYQTIAREANCDRRTAIRSVEQLEALGELVVSRVETAGRGRTNRYAIPALKGDIVPPFKLSTGRNGVTERVTSDPEMVTSHPVKGGISPPEPKEPYEPSRARTRGADQSYFSPGSGRIPDWTSERLADT